MSRIQELIKEKCPAGVHFYKLSEIGNHYTGLSGKTKKDFENGNCKYITYSNVFKNSAIKLDVNDLVYISENEKQNNIEFKDILVTGSSENLEDSGMISVVTEVPKEKIYLNSFCFGFRLNNYFYEKFDATFLKHLFRDNKFRNEIMSCSFGVTRYNLSKEKFSKIKIPCPPIEVQKEIARILDKFGELEAELETELEARKQQYKFWRKYLFNSNNIKSIEDVCLNISSGGTPNTSHREYYRGTVPWLRTQEVNWNIIQDTELKITEEAIKNSSAKVIPKNCVIVAMYGATVGRVAINNIPLSTNQACCNLEINPRFADYKYVFYWLSSQYKYIKSLGQGSQTNINAQTVRKIKIPIPSIEEQQKTVKILDKFDKLINDISEGLPAEIELRRSQYEYYKNKLLSFKELPNEEY